MEGKPTRRGSRTRIERSLSIGGAEDMKRAIAMSLKHHQPAALQLPSAVTHDLDSVSASENQGEAGGLSMLHDGGAAGGRTTSTTTTQPVGAMGEQFDVDARFRRLETATQQQMSDMREMMLKMSERLEAKLTASTAAALLPSPTSLADAKQPNMISVLAGALALDERDAKRDGRQRPRSMSPAPGRADALATAIGTAAASAGHVAGSQAQVAVPAREPTRTAAVAASLPAAPVTPPIDLDTVFEDDAQEQLEIMQAEQQMTQKEQLLMRDFLATPKDKPQRLAPFLLLRALQRFAGNPQPFYQLIYKSLSGRDFDWSAKASALEKAHEVDRLVAAWGHFAKAAVTDNVEAAVVVAATPWIQRKLSRKLDVSALLSLSHGIDSDNSYDLLPSPMLMALALRFNAASKSALAVVRTVRLLREEQEAEAKAVRKFVATAASSFSAPAAPGGPAAQLAYRPYQQHQLPAVAAAAPSSLTGTQEQQQQHQQQQQQRAQPQQLQQQQQQQKQRGSRSRRGGRGRRERTAVATDTATSSAGEVSANAAAGAHKHA